MKKEIIEQFSELEKICDSENQKKEKIGMEIDNLKWKILELNSAVKLDPSPKNLNKCYAEVKKINGLIEEKEYLLSVYGNTGSDLAKNTDFINKLIAFNEVFRKEYSKVSQEKTDMETRFEQELKELKEKHREERAQRQLKDNEFFRMSLKRQSMLKNFLNEFTNIHGVCVCDGDFIEGFWEWLENEKEEIRIRKLAEKEEITQC